MTGLNQFEKHRKLRMALSVLHTRFETSPKRLPRCQSARYETRDPKLRIQEIIETS